RGAQEEKRGAGDGPRSMAAEASARKELFAAPDALIEGAEPTLKGRLASDDPRRDWNADAARHQIRRDRERRPLGVGEPIVTSHRRGVRLKQRHHSALRRGQRPVLWKARRPSTRLVAIVVTGG